MSNDDGINARWWRLTRWWMMMMINAEKREQGMEEGGGGGGGDEVGKMTNEKWQNDRVAAEPLCCYRDLFFDVMSLIGMCPTHLWSKWRRRRTEQLHRLISHIRSDGIVDRPVRNYNFKSYSALICFDLGIAAIICLHFWDIKQTDAGSSVKGGWSRTTQNDPIAAKQRQTNKQMPKNRREDNTQKTKKNWPYWSMRGTHRQHKQIINENTEHKSSITLWKLGKEINMQLGVSNDRPLSMVYGGKKGPMSEWEWEGAHKLNGMKITGWSYASSRNDLHRIKLVEMWRAGVFFFLSFFFSLPFIFEFIYYIYVLGIAHASSFSFIAFVFFFSFLFGCLLFLISTIQLTFIMFRQLKRFDENDPTTQHISHHAILRLCLTRTKFDISRNRNRWWNRDRESERWSFFFLVVCMRFYRRFTLIILLRRSRMLLERVIFDIFSSFSASTFGGGDRPKSKQKKNKKWNQIEMKWRCASSTTCTK